MLSQARLFQLAALHTAAPTLQSTNVYLTHQQTEDLLRPSTPLSSYCCQAHHCHQTAAKHTTVIKRLPGTALSSNCCQAHRYHQIAAKHIPVIKLRPSTSLSSNCCQAHHCHQTAARHTTVIKLLPSTSLSSNCCQAHQSSSCCQAQQCPQNCARHTTVIKLPITLHSAPQPLDQQYVLHSNHENRCQAALCFPACSVALSKLSLKLNK